MVNLTNKHIKQKEEVFGKLSTLLKMRLMGYHPVLKNVQFKRDPTIRRLDLNFSYLGERNSVSLPLI